MSGGIFISYRRDDSRHAAGRLVDRLRQTYAPEQLFMDVDNVAPGRDFVTELSEQVAACEAMIVVIGPNWLDARDGQGVRRLDHAGDFVRVEVETALKHDARVIPVLVDGAQLPAESELPEPLKPLCRRNAVRLTHESFGSDTDRLLRSLRETVEPARKSWLGRTTGRKRSTGRPSTPATAPAAGQPSGGATEVVATADAAMAAVGLAVFGGVAGFLLLVPTIVVNMPLAGAPNPWTSLPTAVLCAALAYWLRGRAERSFGLAILFMGLALNALVWGAVFAMESINRLSVSRPAWTGLFMLAVPVGYVAIVCVFGYRWRAHNTGKAPGTGVKARVMWNVLAGTTRVLVKSTGYLIVTGLVGAVLLWALLTGVITSSPRVSTGPKSVAEKKGPLPTAIGEPNAGAGKDNRDQPFVNAEKPPAPTSPPFEQVTPPVLDRGTAVSETSHVKGFVAIVTSQKSRSEALKAFADVQQRYGGVLAGRMPVIVERDLGDKGIWYRAGLGPVSTRDAAAGMCARMKSTGYSDCWVNSN